MWRQLEYFQKQVINLNGRIVTFSFVKKVCYFKNNTLPDQKYQDTFDFRS